MGCDLVIVRKGPLSREKIKPVALLEIALDGPKMTFLLLPTGYQNLLANLLFEDFVRFLWESELFGFHLTL